MLTFSRRDSPKHAPGTTDHSSRRRGTVLVGALLTLLAMVVASCGTTSSGGGNTPPTVSPADTTVKVFFTRHPDSDSNPTAVFPVTRTVTAATTQERATFALQEMLKGPSQAERAQGYYSPFDGQLALQSYCSGPFRDFDLTLDHKGTTPEKGTATLQFCRRVDIPGDLDGPRMSTMVNSTLAQFAGIQKVVILNYQGSCFDDLQGRNACLDGQASGYPVQVFFSKHPETDTNMSAVFPVNRTAPTLGVATYAVQQLIAGPTAAEQQAGYFTDLTRLIKHGEPSTCGNADFTITLNTRGTTPEPGTVTLMFCRSINSGGIGDDARILAELRATMTQFDSIKQAVILNKGGDCFGDMSGQNVCLKPSGG